MRKFPPFIQTTDKRTYKIDRVYQSRLFINDDIVKAYDVLSEKFYGLKNGEEIELEITPRYPEIYSDWFHRKG